MQQLVNLTSFSFNSVKRSNVAGNRFELKLGKTKLNNTPLPFFIVLASSVQISEIKAFKTKTNALLFYKNDEHSDSK